jgi:hypothetical protein
VLLPYFSVEPHANFCWIHHCIITVLMIAISHTFQFINVLLNENWLWRYQRGNQNLLRRMIKFPTHYDSHELFLKSPQYNDESNKNLRVVQLRSTVIYWNNIGTGTCLYRSTYRYYPHKYNIYRSIFNAGGDLRGRDRMVDGFTTTYANLSPGRWFPPVSSTNKTDSWRIR